MEGLPLHIGSVHHQVNLCLHIMACHMLDRGVRHNHGSDELFKEKYKHDMLIQPVWYKMADTASVTTCLAWRKINYEM